MHLRVCDTCTFWVACGAFPGGQICCLAMSLKELFLPLLSSAVCDGNWQAVCRRWMFIFFFLFFPFLLEKVHVCSFLFIFQFQSLCFLSFIFVLEPFRKVFNVFDLVLKLQSIVFFFLIRSLFFWFWFFFYLALLLKFCWFQFHSLIKIYVVLFFFPIYPSFLWFSFSFVKVFFLFDLILQFKLFWCPLIYFLFWN